jgi:hypothetical protein
MSVVAGCLLLDGVLLAADTRITYTRSDGSHVFVDNALKIFLFAPGTAIGYVGTVETASLLLQHMIAGRDRRKRTDPLRLYRWIPRLLRAVYRRLPSDLQRQVSFMVASSFADTPKTVETATIWRMLFEASKNGMNSITGTLPFDILSSGKAIVQIPNTCDGMLYSMSSPNFEPRVCPPLGFMAIGSGHKVVEDVERDHARIVLGDVNSPWEADWFRRAIKNFVERNSVDEVGGLYPVLKVRGNETAPVGMEVRSHKQGSSEVESDVALLIEDGQWIQRERLSGVAVTLQPPWDLLKNATHNALFDHIDSRRWRKRTNANPAVRAGRVLDTSK